MQQGMLKASGKPEDPSKKLEKVHVLILDSSTQVTELFKKMLEEVGFTKVFIGNNGLQGVQILREIKINLIITDWELKIPRPVEKLDDASTVHEEIIPLSGIDFVKRLRHAPSSPSPFVSIIMLADAMEKIQVLSARDAGVNEICIKPLSAQQLFDKIMAVIDRPRIFVTAESYRGPCRRRKNELPKGQEERRKHEVRVIKLGELQENQ